MTTKTFERDALDLWESEDHELRRIFRQLDESRSGTVEDRDRYGSLAKEVIRHVAVREATLVDVAGSLDNAVGLEEMTARMMDKSGKRRIQIDRVEKMSRGVQGINLNTGQDFDAELLKLREILDREIEWDLTEAIPRAHKALPRTHGTRPLKTAHHVERHAPTNIRPEGPRWIERAPVISRVITLYDHLRDFPKAAHLKKRGHK